ncbi:autotransporter-associated beta strand repeat-containing protein [Streptomyces sp. NPDC052236]|uniref:autotransporter-associated beta strand repeat-containing protein n=1 Tax=Streptomyces sp. NPDC052236 TaxID=3365686 RepID=UPI0037D19BC9
MNNAAAGTAWAAALAAMVIAAPVPDAVAAPAGARDVTAAVLADRDVTLDGDVVVTVPPGTTTYDGVFRGEGTLTVRGSGTLVLTKDSDFTLPRSRQRQVVTTRGGNHPYTTVTHPDPPAVTVERGATLQYGTGGGTGLIGHFPYRTPGYRLNQDNIRVDGTLRLSLVRTFNIGTISGSGLVSQPRFMWGTLDLAGTHPFSGVIDNGTGMAVGRPEYAVALPRARAVLNQRSWIIDTPLYQTITLRQNFYQREYGSDVNVHSRPGSKVVLTGQYSYSDRGGDTNPSLSDPAVNWRKIPHDLNKRGTNIEGANVQWGDGTTSEIFMPGTKDTVYINLHQRRERSRLAFDYNGPVTLGAPIGGGMFHDTLAAPGAGDIVIKGTRGNDVTFAAEQYYDGSTTVEKRAVLRLGSGKAGGDGSLLTGSERRRIVNDGALFVRNATKPISLSRISGSGSFTQAGAATTTLTGGISYTGPTTVARGTLALTGGGSLERSSEVRLTGAGTRLDLRKAGDRTVRRLTAAKGSRVLVGAGRTLDVSTGLGGYGTVEGSVAGGGAVSSTVTVTGDYTQRAEGRLTVRSGQPLRVGGRVRLAGRLDVTGGADPAKKFTLIDNTGKKKVSGTFTGLGDGDTVEVAGVAYRISYGGGDGNDVVLEAAEKTTAGPSAEVRSDAGPKAEQAAGSSEGSRPWWALLLVPLLVPLSIIVRRPPRRTGGHRAHRRG